MSAGTAEEADASLRALFVPGMITLDVFKNADVYRRAHLRREKSKYPSEHRDGVDNELGIVRWTADYLNCLRALAGSPAIGSPTMDDIALITATMLHVSATSMGTTDWGQRGLIKSLHGVMSVIAQREDAPLSSLRIVMDSATSALNGNVDDVSWVMYPATSDLDTVIDPLLENRSITPGDIERLITSTWEQGMFDSGESVIESLTELTGYFAFQRLWESDYRRVDVLVALAASPSQAARYFAARNVHTPVPVLCGLSSPESGTHEDVRSAVAANDSIPRLVAERMLNDPSPRVRAHALLRIAREQTPDAYMVAKCLPIDLIHLLPGPNGNNVGTPPGWDREPWVRSGGPLMLQCAAAMVTPGILSVWASSPDPDDHERASAFIVATVV